jgi:hypothetical protein
VAKKNTGPGGFDRLTMKQTDKLASKLGKGAARLVAENEKDPFSLSRHQAAMEIYEVTEDLHNSWMQRNERGER